MVQTREGLGRFTASSRSPASNTAEKQLAKCNLEEDESITFKNEKEHCRIKSPKRSGEGLREDHELSGLYGTGNKLESNKFLEHEKKSWIAVRQTPFLGLKCPTRVFEE